MNEEVIKSLLLDVHKAIEDTSNCTVDSITFFSPSYPPGVKLSEEEELALNRIEKTDVTRNALCKVIADACAYPVFHLFSLMDGVVDPELYKMKEWVGASLCDKQENANLSLHDAFYESYWEYHEAIKDFIQ